MALNGRPKSATSAASSWSGLGRAVDQARKADLQERRKSVLLDEQGAVVGSQVGTLVQLMRHQITPEESVAILCTLARTAKHAPDRLHVFVQVGGVAALGQWLRVAAVRPQSGEHRKVATGSLRILARLPVQLRHLEETRIALDVKDLGDRCDYAQKDVQALRQRWWSDVLRDREFGNKDCHRQSPAMMDMAAAPCSKQVAAEPRSPPLLALPCPTAADDRVGEFSRVSSGGGRAGDDSRYIPRKPGGMELREAKRRCLGSAQTLAAAGPSGGPAGVSTEGDLNEAEVRDMLKELISLNEVLSVNNK